MITSDTCKSDLLDWQYLIQNLLILAKLPKWFGERPGKKAGEPETPEGEEDAKVEEVEEEVEEEEEHKGKHNSQDLNFCEVYCWLTIEISSFK